MIQIQNAMAQPLPSTRSPLCMLTRTGDPKTGIAWIPGLIWLLSATAMTISTTRSLKRKNTVHDPVHIGFFVRIPHFPGLVLH